MGYNDKLPGEWPADYIGKAAEFGILDGISFIADKAASRGEVAIMVSKILDQYVVCDRELVWPFVKSLKVEADIIENGDPQKEVPSTLLQDNFNINSAE